MNLVSATGLGALAALVVSGSLAGVLAWCGPVDRPRARGMHKAPTPTSGGLAIAGGTAAALLAGLAAVHLGTGAALVATLILAFSHALLGAVDDVVDLGAKMKLLVQLVLAVVFAVAVHPTHIPLWSGAVLDLPPFVSVPGVALWLVVTINAVNFMDGSNGLMAGSLAIVLGGLGLVGLGGPQPFVTIALLGAAAAGLGFLPWNFPKARLFQGDSGALFLGALVAGLAAAAASSTPPALTLFAAPTALLPLLVDVLLTLLMRARRRQSLLEAHRDHLYQRWLSVHGGDHAALAWRFWLIMALYTAAAAAGAALAGPPAPLLVFLVGLGVAVFGWVWIGRGLKAKTAN